MTFRGRSDGSWVTGSNRNVLLCLDVETVLFCVLLLTLVCHFVKRFLQIGIVFQEVIDDRLLRCVTGTYASHAIGKK